MDRAERRARTERAHKRKDQRWEGVNHVPLYKVRHVPANCRCDYCLPQQNRARQNDRYRAIQEAS